MRLMTMLAAQPTPKLLTHLAGDPSAAETLVFVHGWPDDQRVWTPLLSCADGDMLSQSRCVLVELPRADGADWEAEDLSFPRLAFLLAETIRSEAGRPVTLVGHDWGCQIVAMVLRDYPDLVKRVVLMDVGVQPRNFLASPWLAFRGLSILSYFCVNIAIHFLGLVKPLRFLADAINARWISLLCKAASPSFSMDDRPTSSSLNYFYAYASAPCAPCAPAGSRASRRNVH